MQARGQVQAPPLDTADIEPWLRLFDQLDTILVSGSGLEAQRVFRALGRARWANAHRRLLREKQRLLVEIESIGACPVGARIRPAAAPRDAGSLDTDYSRLAEAFALCAPIANRLGKVALRQWLLERARMHRQHALFLMT